MATLKLNTGIKMELSTALSKAENINQGINSLFSKPKLGKMKGLASIDEFLKEEELIVSMLETYKSLLRKDIGDGIKLTESTKALDNQMAK